MYNPYYPPYQGIQQNPFRCRAVTSVNEASAAMVDMSGVTDVFVNRANGEVYIKQLGMDGRAIFEVYQRVQPVAPQMPQNQSQASGGETIPGYDVKAEVERIRAELDGLKKELGLDGGNGNAK